MHADEQSIRGLRQALEVSPENVPLRMMLADGLTTLGRLDEAKEEYRAALSIVPQSVEIKLALARVYARQAQPSAALVIVEDLIRAPQPPASALLLYSRLLWSAGEVARAVHYYRGAVEAEPELADRGFEDELGIGKNLGDSAEVVDGRIRERVGEPDRDAGNRPTRPRITFADVGGMESVKDEIRVKIIHPLTHRELYASYGKAIGGGILMYGPPGCGKTYLARATAGEIQASFLSVGLHDILDMWVGQSERKLHDIFEQARADQPCVLFFDEVDALGASRADMRQSSGRHLINQFLAELDGVTASNEGILVLGATNAPWHLDPAFRRPGRFDRILFVPPPDRAARAAVLSLHLAGKPLDGVDVGAAAEKMDHFSGADVKAVVDLAVEAKLRDAVKSGVPSPLRTKDLLAAVRAVRATTKEWFATARNYALYSNEGGLYDDIVTYLKLK